MLFVNMLMDLKNIPFVVERRVHRLMERRETSASEIDHRPMNLLDHAYGSALVGLRFMTELFPHHTSTYDEEIPIPPIASVLSASWSRTCVVTRSSRSIHE